MVASLLVLQGTVNTVFTSHPLEMASTNCLNISQVDCYIQMEKVPKKPTKEQYITWAGRPVDKIRQVLATKKK